METEVQSQKRKLLGATRKTEVIYEVSLHLWFASEPEWPKCID